MYQYNKTIQKLISFYDATKEETKTNSLLIS